MNLNTHIKQELWLAVSSTYDSENYSHAILDAMHYLSNLLREKSGTDGDGSQLVGKILGGDSPILRVNKFQTISEKDIQRGLEHILRGLYIGIRNPRSHEQLEDSKETADAVIYFINFLIGILDKSKEPFTTQNFITRVFDEDFVRSQRYAELLVKEVPLSKRFDVLVEIYRRKQDGNGNNLGYVLKEILKELPEKEIKDFLLIVSEELKFFQKDIDIRIILQILPPELWPQVEEVARLRIENRLIKSIKDGQATFSGEVIQGNGALGTWAMHFLKHFQLQREVAYSIVEKFEKDESNHYYVFRFFMDALPMISDYHKNKCITNICKIIQQNEIYKDKVYDKFWSFPEDWRNSMREIIPDIFPLEPLDDIPF